MKRRFIASIIVIAILMVFIYHGGRKIAYDLFLNIGIKLEEKGEISGAINALERAAAFLRSQSSIYARIGDVGIREYDAILVKGKDSQLGKEGSLDISVRNFMKSLRYNPQNPWAWSGLSEYFERKSYLVAKPDVINISKLQYGDFGKLDYEDWMAIFSAKKALQLEPNNYFYHDLIGFIYQENELRERAMGEYEKSLELLPEISKHFFTPVGLMPDDMRDAIIRGMRKALETNEAIPLQMMHEHLAYFLKKHKNYEEARHHFEKALELSDTEMLRGNDMLEIGTIDYFLKDYDKALDALQKSVFFTPREARAFFFMGQIHKEKGNGEKALENFRKAVLFNPKEYQFAIVYAEECFRAGNPVEAERYFQKALKLNPERSEAHLGLIELYRTYGYPEKAAKVAEKLQALEKAHE
ncbi:MAG: tetratricopeptide repeat protein [Acidobacteriota bacterium]